MVEQAFVHVPDLLDVQGAEAEPARLGRAAARHPDLQHLQRVQQVQHGAIVDRQRPGRGGPPTGAGQSPLQEGEAVRVEQAAAVGRQIQAVVGDAGMDGAERGEQAAPGVEAALQHLFAVPVGGFAELGAQGGDGVVLVVEGIAQAQHAALLGGEEKHEAPHHGEGGFVEHGGLDVGAEELAAAVLVGAVDRLDEHLDGAADLGAELAGDLVLVGGAGG